MGSSNLDRCAKLRPVFNGTVKPPQKRPSPVSVRLSAEERARVEHDADGMSLNAYIRSRILGRAALSHLTKPQSNKVMLAQILAILGKMNLSSNFNDLAHAAKIGALPVTPETEVAIRKACADVSEIKSILMVALRIKEA